MLGVILSNVTPSPQATPNDDAMSPAYREALRIGTDRLSEAMREARLRVNLSAWCTGREDCQSSHHLACCLRPTATKRKR